MLGNRTINKKYSTRLKCLLEELDIKQNELAEKAGITEATISNYINGKQLPKLGVVEKLSDILGVSVDYLLGKTDIRNLMTDKEFTKSLLTSDFINLMNLTEEQRKTLNILVEGFKKENEKKSKEN